MSSGAVGMAMLSAKSGKSQRKKKFDEKVRDKSGEIDIVLQMS